jgi:hypothetical protein
MLSCKPSTLNFTKNSLSEIELGTIESCLEFSRNVLIISSLIPGSFSLRSSALFTSFKIRTRSISDLPLMAVPLPSDPP